jgi:hypothetical protein
MFPPSMLAQLFVKNSLKNTDAGFQFKLRNVIDSGTVAGMGPLVVDETSYPTSQYRLKTSGRDMQADQISYAQSVPVWQGAEITVSVDGAALAAGEHKITMQILTLEAGRLQFTVSDTIAE